MDGSTSMKKLVSLSFWAVVFVAVSMLLFLKVQSQTTATVWTDSSRVFLSGNPRYLDGSVVDPFTTALQVVVFDTTNIDPVRRQVLDSALSFPTSLLNCAKVFYYEAVYTGRIINSASIAPGSGITRDLSGNNFKLVNCANPPSSSNEVRLDGSAIRIFSPSRRLLLVNGLTIDMNSTPLNVVIFDGRSFLRRVPLVYNNDSFSSLEVPCAPDVRWYYETSFDHQPANSGFLNAGPGITKNFANQNFQLTSCSNNPPPAAGSLVYLNGPYITLSPASNQVTLVNGSVISPYSNPLEAVIFDLFGRGISYVVWLDSNLSFNRSIIPSFGNYVWFYRLRGGGMAVNSATLNPGTCVARDSTGGNFRLICN